MSVWSAFRPRSPDNGSQDVGFLEEDEDNQGQPNPALPMSYTQEIMERGRTSGSILQSAGQLDPVLEAARVQDTALLLLPLLLANPPNIPSYLKSSELKERHKVLSITVHEPDDYLVTLPPSADVDVKERAMSGLEDLKAKVEQLAGILATDTDAIEHTVSKVKWHCPEEKTVLANMILGGQTDDIESGLENNVLSLILKREDEVRARPEPWKFHNLLPAGCAGGEWKDSLPEALQSLRRSAASALSVSFKNLEPRTRLSRSVTSTDTSVTVGSSGYATANEMDDGSNIGDSEQGRHGQPSKATYASADDFWSGWDSDEAESKQEQSQESLNDEEESGANSEDDYWNSYDTSNPQDDLQRREAEQAEAQQRLDQENLSQFGSVNFDGLERRMETDAGCFNQHDESRVALQHRKPSMEFIQRPFNEEQTYESLPAGGSSTLDSLLASSGTLRGSSPVSDATSYGGTDSADEVTISEARLHGNSEQSVPSEGHTGDQGSTAVASPTVAIPDIIVSRPSVQQKSPHRSKASISQYEDRPRRDEAVLGLGDLAEEQQRQLGKMIPPPPMSVSGQSTYETPENMSLAELETLHRDRDQKRIVEMRERMARMSKPSRNTKRQTSAFVEEEEEDQEEERDSDLENAIKKARTALEGVVPDYSGLPGFELLKSSRKSKSNSFPSQQDMVRSHGTSSRVQNQLADPVEALSQADPDIALGTSDPEPRDKAGLLPVNTRAVSMDTLRKLTEQHKLNSPGDGLTKPAGSNPSKSAEKGTGTSTSGSTSKAGGFRNFLQLAPSTIVTDLDSQELDQEADDAGEGEPIEGEPDAEPAEEEEDSPASGTNDDGFSEAPHREEMREASRSVEHASEQVESEPQERAQDEAYEPRRGNGAAPSDTADDVHQVTALRQNSEKLDGSNSGDEETRTSKIVAEGERVDHQEAQSKHSEDGIQDGDTYSAESGDKQHVNIAESFERRQEHQEEEVLGEETNAIDPSMAAQGSDGNGTELDAFILPDPKVRGKRLDSPSLADDDALLRQAMSVIASSQQGRDETRDVESTLKADALEKRRNNTTPSDSFRPSAASDASVRPLLGSLVQRLHSNESGSTNITQSAVGPAPNKVRTAARPNSDVGAVPEEGEDSLERELAAFRQKNAALKNNQTRPTKQDIRQAPRGPLRSGVQNDTQKPAARPKYEPANSTSTDLGLADGDEGESERFSVAPGPQWVGAAPPPGSMSQRTANLRHEYLKAQRQQALEVQRNRIQAQRQQKQQQKVDPDEEDSDTPAPLARGAEARAPFPQRAQSDRRSNGVSNKSIKDNEHAPTAEEDEDGTEERHKEEEGPEWGALEAQDGNILGDAEPPSPATPRAAGSIELAPPGLEDGIEQYNGEDEEDLSVPGKPLGQRRQNNTYQIRQQEARQHASQAASRRREVLRAAQRRTTHVRTLLRSVVDLLNDDAEDVLGGGSSKASVSESDFLRICREAFRESEKARADRIANGAGGHPKQ